MRFHYRLDGWRLPFAVEVTTDSAEATDRDLATTEIAVIETEAQKS